MKFALESRGGHMVLLLLSPFKVSRHKNFGFAAPILMPDINLISDQKRILDYIKLGHIGLSDS